MRTPWPVTPMKRVSPSSRAWTSASNGAARAVRRLPLVLLDEVVQLDQVDVVDAHPLERPLEARPGVVRSAIAGLRRQEDLVAMLRQPRCEEILGHPVRGRGVPVVDAELEQHVEHRVGLLLRGVEQPGTTEDHPAALMSRPSELSTFDHHLDVRPTVHANREVPPRTRCRGCVSGPHAAVPRPRWATSRWMWVAVDGGNKWACVAPSSSSTECGSAENANLRSPSTPSTSRGDASSNQLVSRCNPYSCGLTNGTSCSPTVASQRPKRAAARRSGYESPGPRPSQRQLGELRRQAEPHPDPRQVAQRAIDGDHLGDPQLRPIDRVDALAVLDRTSLAGDVADNPRDRTRTPPDLDALVGEAIEAVGAPPRRRRRRPPLPRRVVVVGRRPPQRQLRPADRDVAEDDAVVADRDVDRAPPTSRRSGRRLAAELDHRRRRRPAGGRPRRTVPSPRERTSPSPPPGPSPRHGWRAAEPAPTTVARSRAAPTRRARHGARRSSPPTTPRGRRGT